MREREPALLWCMRCFNPAALRLSISLPHGTRMAGTNERGRITTRSLLPLASRN